MSNGKLLEAPSRQHLLDEHQKLIELVKQLIALYRDGTDWEKTLLTLDRLEAASHDYFALEEAYFQAAGSPLIALIVSTHRSLLAQLADTSAKIRGNKGKARAEFYLFLTAWENGDLNSHDWSYGRMSERACVPAA